MKQTSAKSASLTLACALAAPWSPACSSASQTPGPAAPNAKASGSGPSDRVPSIQNDGRTDGGSGDGHATDPQAGGGQGGGTNTGKGGGTPDGGEAAMAKLLADCNVAQAMNAAPGTVLYQKHLQGADLTKTVAIVNVTASPTLDIKVTDGTTVQTSTVKVKSITPPALATLARGQAEQQAAANSGTTTLTNVVVKDAINLSSQKNWDKIVCTLVATTRIDNAIGTSTTSAAFDPPLPSAPNPMTAASRYQDEIGGQRVFSGITATIKSSTNPALANVTTLTGSVTVQKVTPSISQNGVTLTGDMAFQITNSFGTPDQTWALGLPPTMVVVIDTAKKDMVGTLIDTTKVTGGVVGIFSGQ